MVPSESPGTPGWYWAAEGLSESQLPSVDTETSWSGSSGWGTSRVHAGLPPSLQDIELVSRSCRSRSADPRAAKADGPLHQFLGQPGRGEALILLETELENLEDPSKDPGDVQD